MDTRGDLKGDIMSMDDPLSLSPHFVKLWGEKREWKRRLKFSSHSLFFLLLLFSFFLFLSLVVLVTYVHCVFIAQPFQHEFALALMWIMGWFFPISIGKKGLENLETLWKIKCCQVNKNLQLTLFFSFGLSTLFLEEDRSFLAKKETINLFFVPVPTQTLFPPRPRPFWTLSIFFFFSFILSLSFLVVKLPLGQKSFSLAGSNNKGKKETPKRKKKEKSGDFSRFSPKNEWLHPPRRDRHWEQQKESLLRIGTRLLNYVTFNRLQEGRKEEKSYKFKSVIRLQSLNARSSSFFLSNNMRERHTRKELLFLLKF